VNGNNFFITESSWKVLPGGAAFLWGAWADIINSKKLTAIVKEPDNSSKKPWPIYNRWT
jgi:hypothetical protein